MSDEDAVPVGDGRAVKVALYMETLQARMDPAQYEALAQAVHEAFCLLAQGREGIISGEDGLSFTPEMHREFATVVTMMLTGKMDQQVVELSGPDGHSGFVLMDPEKANDPAKVQEVRDFINRWTAEREAMDIELDGIARASNPSPDD
ncbi:hypothetical protein [Streptomyces werraensis]|uniref:hypothetical protein n=1 Tax=Streptomyces werraensis TaxID=68284 RepID=UPI00369CED2C